MNPGGETHEVANQVPPFEDVDLFETDRALAEALEREGGGAFRTRVAAFGALLGSAHAQALGRDANRHSPELRTHDRTGRRIDEVAFHPAWHEVMRLAMAASVHNLPWREPVAGAYVARGALHLLLAEVEAGTCCPLTMTFACVPALRCDKAIAEAWEPALLGNDYDPRLVPLAAKRSALVGMAMTEKQGGSDVRANTTRAESVDGDGAYRLVGHKWFCSAPMSDAFLTLAQTGPGLTCFLVPRVLPDGTRNAFAIQRLKDKLGNRSNASSEIEYRGTHAFRVGEEGRGVRTILEMVHHTRLDCVTGSAGLLRRAVAEAAHHAAHRSAFGRRLADQPLMQSVLADLALESEAATALGLRLARAYDEAAGDAQARAFARIATAVAKYWVCKRAPAAIYEAMECLGGNGYVEESILPRLYREAPVNAIWEGSGNVICLDVLRAIVREPESLPALLAELRLARGGHPAFDAACAALEADLADPSDAESRARRLVERLALALQASILLRAVPSVGEAFCAARLADHPGLTFGALPSAIPRRALVSRILPL
jgi:putative acyl-CoA dehydrogenase